MSTEGLIITLKTVIISVIVFNVVVEAMEDESESKSVDDLKFSCSKMCNTSGAETEFDKENLNCKCVLVEDVDGIEMKQIRQQLQKLKISLHNLVEPTVNMKLRRKRFIPRKNDNKIIYYRHEPILGQALVPHQPPSILPHNPQKPVLPHSPTHLRPHGKASHLPTNPAIQKHIEKIRQRIHELANARNAQARLDNIKKHLQQLRDRAAAASGTEHGARAKGVQHRFPNEKRRQQNLHHGGLLGAAHESDAVTTAATQIKKGRKEHKSKAIITQPEYLNDEDD